MRGRDVLLAAVLAAIIAIDVPSPDGWPLALLCAGPLVFISAAPLACVIAICVGFGAYGLFAGDPDSAATLPPLLLAAYSVGSHPVRTHARLGLVALLAFAVSVGFLTPDSEGDIVFVAILLGFPWTAGMLARDHTDRSQYLQVLAVELEREQHEHERLARASERARIAAELNDAVAHAVGAMTMQAGAAAQALDRDPAAAAAAIEAVESTGRDALLELQRMLGLLRGTGTNGP